MLDLDLNLLSENIRIHEQIFAETKEQLDKRCEGSKIKVQISRDDFDTLVIDLIFPCGREERHLILEHVKDVQMLLDIPFEKYIFIGSYESICSYTDGTIEAAIRTIDQQSISWLLEHEGFDKIFDSNHRQFEEEEESLSCCDQEDESTDSSKKISISVASKEFMAILSPHMRGQKQIITMKIEGLSISNHDLAKSALERISNSLFFQIDIELGVPLTLQREIELSIGRHRRSLRRTEGFKLQFPRTEYNEAPMELYWYAQSAVGMPLLQFLAFYQAIEYYFPIYSRAEALRKVRNILKDPSFRAERDADVGRVLTALSSKGHSGFGDERTQLKAVLLECVDSTVLQKFLEDNKERQAFFCSKTKGLTDKKLSVNNSSADLRTEVAERIYDIRCKIVHTKSGGTESEVELLLPFSKEATLLHLDIELIELVTRQVLIAASTALQL